MHPSLKKLNSLLAVTAFCLLGFSANIAQADIYGHWNPIMHEDRLERGPGPMAGDYAGLPINDAARMRADSWTASLLTVPEHQCKPHPATYGFRGVGNLRVWQVIDEETQELTAIRTHISWQAQKRTIWMDGRDHPDEMYPHSWGGFSTGHFEGDTLVVETTHIKNSWMRRNGLAFSDAATMLEYFIPHGDTMTHVMMVSDPVYLDDVFIKTNGFSARAQSDMSPYPCRCAIEIEREEGEIPHYLPGQNPAPVEFAEENGIPYEAGRGGGITMLPEYMDIVQAWRMENMTYEERMGDGIPPGNER